MIDYLNPTDIHHSLRVTHIELIIICQKMLQMHSKYLDDSDLNTLYEMTLEMHKIKRMFDKVEKMSLKPLLDRNEEAFQRYHQTLLKR